MKKSILKMTGLVVVAVMFCILYMTCNDNGANDGSGDYRADAFVRKFNKPPTGDEAGNATDSTTPADTGVFTDARDGQTYRKVTIGTQTWMAQNLNYETDSSWCYNNDTAKCAVYGRLYQWEAAMTACPAGWRLPDTADWNTLVSVVGGSLTAGIKLKATRGWYRSSDNTIYATDDYGFSALPGGLYYYYEGYEKVGDVGVWWTSVENTQTERSYFQCLRYSDNNMVNDQARKTDLHSVRCVKIL
jgi:uncharacterized protein (TIGR02145 family)